jgi:DNA-binding MarR family transcriptional regulator
LIPRLVGEEGVRVRDLPRLAGVSKEAIAASVSFLTKRGYAHVKPGPPGSRVNVLMLTGKGREAQHTYIQLLMKIEERWHSRFGKQTLDRLRRSLERLVPQPNAQPSPLFRGLEPYPDGWRASVPRRERLAHFPMVLHRGEFPDGS